MSIVNYEIINQVGVIRLNNPPVNALSQALRQGILEAVSEAQDDSSQALLIVCEGRTFIAGADIREFGRPPQPPALPDVMSALENSSKPVIAALHGNALGGGLEIAMACHYRCAMSDTQLGLPEVKLGLIPGAGGTQRGPRLMGVKAALELATSGEPISAQQALNAGLIDAMLDSDGEHSLIQGAITYATNLIANKAPCKRARDITLNDTPEIHNLLEQQRQQLTKRARGQDAPQHIVNSVGDAVTLPFEEGLAAERERFLACKLSPQSAAMRHIFFAEREAAKVSGIDKNTPPRPINRIAIIGGGTMGAGIAINFANAGLPVTLLEINNDALQRGLDNIQKIYQQSLNKGKITQTTYDECLARIEGSTEYTDLKDVDLVVEAVFESIDIKQTVFRQLDSVCKPGAILATNTSYQDINLIASATSRPQDVIGLHFFSPAHIMKLLEVIRGDETADDVIVTAMKLAKTINKLPVLAGNCYGFIGNRMLRQYAGEAQRCLIEGATPEQIDSVMQTWGMAMGPLAVGDLAGLDIGYKARQTLSDEQKGEPVTYCIPDALVESGRLGQKTGKGYYLYDADSRVRQNDPEVLALVEQQAASHGIQRREISDEEILNRLTFALVNEGAKILSEGIAQRPGDIDSVYVFGYGFPKYRGGPMHFADRLGLDTITDYLNQNPHVHHLKPAPLLNELATQGKSFAEWAKQR